VGEAVGLRDLLTLDMGGTSADASLVTGGVALAEGSAVVGGIPLGLPAILLETVSAGGGSIATIDEGGALKVGPASAGAVPGPACYGRGGTLPTVTDACLVLGWLSEDQLLADRVRLDRGAAEGALGMLGKTLRRDARHVAAGIIEVASAVMARALKRVSVARGADPRNMALLPFGGAGPLFGCALAEALGMDAIVVPPHPGVLSALGLAAASEREDFVAAFHRPVHELSNGKLETGFRPLLEQAAAALPGAAVVCTADCRFAGQGYEITVNADYTDPAALHLAFLTAHARRHGHADPALEVEVVNLRVTAMRVGPSRVPLAAPPAAASPTRRSITLRASPVVEVTADVWPLGALPSGLEIRGPAVLMGPDATGVIEPGWTGQVHDSGAIIVRRSRA
jgi:N-methylhydantoinase A